MKRLLLILLTVLGCSCEEPRTNCYTCLTRCHPFRVSACEPAWSRLNPIYCGCDPFTRVDEPPTTISAMKEGKR